MPPPVPQRSNQHAPWWERVHERAAASRRYPWIVTVTLLFGMFWVASTITILTVSRPTIAEDLDASVGSLVWVISGPTVAFALIGTTAGKLGDLHGHRRVYLLGMSGAALFSLACAMAWSGGSLIAFRVAGAALGAVAGPCSLAIINRLFRPAERSKALGFWSLVVAGGPVVGLALGGPLVEAVGWRVIFWAQAPLIAASVAVSFVLLPRTERRPDVHFDVAGQAMLFLTLGSLLFAMATGAALAHWVLDVDWWVGVLLGAACVFFGTCGDLIESSIKRDVGIKDMSSILPGHGGVMDRLDSMLVAAAPAWLVMYLFVPGG